MALLRTRGLLHSDSLQPEPRWLLILVGLLLFLAIKHLEENVCPSHYVNAAWPRTVQHHSVGSGSEEASLFSSSRSVQLLLISNSLLIASRWDTLDQKQYSVLVASAFSLSALSTYQ